MLERNDFIIKDIGCGVADLAGIQVDPSTLLLRVTFATAATCDVFLPLRAVPRSWCPLSGLQQDIGVWVGPWRLCTSVRFSTIPNWFSAEDIVAHFHQFGRVLRALLLPCCI